MESSNIKTLCSIDTEFSADSVEFCPSHHHQNVCAVGTYQVLEGNHQEQQSEAQHQGTQRTGRLLLYDTKIDQNNDSDIHTVKEIQRLDTNAILDLKWSHQTSSSDPILALADAKSKIQLYKLSDENQLMKSIEFQSQNHSVLNLSLDWGNRVDKQTNSITFSQSNGNICLLRLKDDGNLIVEEEWRGHSYEAWISAFDYWNPSTIYTGADDCLFKKWDLRVGTDQPMLISKRHSAGVCSIHSHPLKEFQLATGSYDEYMFIWDTRQMKRPVSEFHVGGGVWRLKWHPENPSLLLAAAMHHGFYVFNIQSDQQVELYKSYMEHSSLAYGADWSYEFSNRIGTCSFYDKLFRVWEF